jgi:hypothetical protein
MHWAREQRLAAKAQLDLQVWGRPINAIKGNAIKVRIANINVNFGDFKDASKHIDALTATTGLIEGTTAMLSAGAIAISFIGTDEFTAGQSGENKNDSKRANTHD